MRPALKSALKILGAGLAIVLGVGGTAAYFGMRLKADPNALSLGAVTPRVDLVDSEGRPVSFPVLDAPGLPVLVFYRGHW